MKFSTGYRPSPPEEVGLGSLRKFAASPVPERSYVDLPTALDQGSSSSCTGNASAVAICAAMARASGLPPGQFPELPSRLFLYYGARAGIGETGRDEGAMIHSIFDCASKLGVPPESAWPFSDKLGDIIRQPDWTALQAAADQKIVDGAYRITSVGRERADDVARAMGAGSAVVWGTAMDMAVFDLETNPEGVWPGIRGPIISGHAMVLHGHEPWSGTQRRYLSRTSWGADWGRSGSFWVSEEAVSSSHASDFWVVSMAPEYSRTEAA